MLEVELKCEPREAMIKSALKKLRQDGNVPAVLYGGKEKPLHLTVPSKEFTKAAAGMAGLNTVFHLKMKSGAGETEHLAMIAEAQRDPVKEHFVHADFKRISMDQPVTVLVLVKTTGSAEGVRAGGVLEFLGRTLTVRCLPRDIPEAIVLDVTALKIGQVMHVSDIHLSLPGVEIVEDPRKSVLMIGIPSELKEEEVAATAVPAAGTEEPEVIGEKERLERRAAKEAGKEGAKAEDGKEGAKPGAAPAKAAGPAKAAAPAKDAKK